MHRSNLLCSLASSNESHVLVVCVGGWQSGAQQVEAAEGRWSKACVGLTHTGHETSHRVRRSLPLVSFMPSCFSQPKGHFCLETCALLSVGLFLLSVARSLEEVVDTLKVTILKALFCPTIFTSPTLPCHIHGLAGGFSNHLQSMSASWSSLRWQNGQRHSECQHKNNLWVSTRSDWKCRHEKCRANPC